MYIVSNQAIATQEAIGRQIFVLQHPGNQWVNNNEKFGQWDVSGSTKSNSATAPSDKYIEIKARQIRSSDYLSTFLEVKKYDQLMALAIQTKTGKAFYFVTFTDNTALLFDLKNIRNIEKFKETRLMKEVTLEGQTKLVEKEIYDLPLGLAVKKYTY